MGSNYDKCRICKEWGWLDTHVCKPKWLVVLHEYHEGEERDYVHTDNAEDGAIRYAELNFDNWEYPEEMEIWIKEREQDEWIKFTVTVAPVPEFTAELIKEGD